MKQSGPIVIGIAIVVVVIAVSAYALSGYGGRPNANATTSVNRYSTTATTSAAPAPGSPTSGYDLMVGSSASVGRYLETSAGFTLYLLSSDIQYKSSTCTGACVDYWPPYLFNGSISSLSVQSGINASALGVITRPDGSRQLTYDGWPLYRFSGDKAAGQVSGEGIAAFGGVWYAVTVPNATV